MSKYKVTKIVGVTLVAGGLVAGGVLGLNGKDGEEVVKSDTDKNNNVSQYNKPPVDKKEDKEKENKEKENKEDVEESKEENEVTEENEQREQQVVDVQEDQGQVESNDGTNEVVVRGSVVNNDTHVLNNRWLGNTGNVDSFNKLNNNNIKDNNNKSKGSNNKGNSRSNNKGSNVDKSNSKDIIDEVVDNLTDERKKYEGLVNEYKGMQKEFAKLQDKKVELVNFKGGSITDLEIITIKDLMEDAETALKLGYKELKSKNMILSVDVAMLKVTLDKLKDEVTKLETEEVVKKDEVFTEEIPYNTDIVKEYDTKMIGWEEVIKEGQSGTRYLLYDSVVYVDMKLEGFGKIKDSWEDAPVNAQIAVGTMDIEDEIENEVEYETKEEEDPTLEEGLTEVVQEGKDGKDKVVYHVGYTQGEETHREEVSRETIEPVDEIIKVGTMVEEVSTKELSYETEEVEVPTLEKGKTNVTQKGVKGEKEFTYNVGTVNGKEEHRELVDEKVIKEPVNEVIEVGTMVTKHEENEIGFEVKTVENPKMSASEEPKVATKGKKGLEKVTYNVGYVKGKEEYRKEVSKEVVEEPRTEVVEVGTMVQENKEENIVEFETKEVEDDTLEEGKTKVTQKGVNGKDTVVYNVGYVDGKEVHREEVSRDTIEPVDEIVKVGTMKVEITEETEENRIKYRTVEEEDPTLEVGKTEVKQQGKDGKEVVTYEVRYENGKQVDKKEVSREVVTKPVNEIILVGTKEKEDVITYENETVSEDIAYETKYEDDPTLEKGETKVKQKGEKGTKEITYKVTYKNGEKTDHKEEVERITVKEPVDEIILKGTKVTEVKTETVTEDIDFGVKTVEDNTLEKGKEVVDFEGQKGVKEITYDVTYVNGEETDRVETNSKVVKEAKDKVVRVGTKEVEQGVDVAEFERRVAELINEERAKLGLAPLEVNIELGESARQQSEWMAETGRLEHRGTMGEIIAKDAGSPEGVVQAWMESEGHREHIIGKDIDLIGVGYVENGNYWTAHFWMSKYDLEDRVVNSNQDDKTDEENSKEQEEDKQVNKEKTRTVSEKKETEEEQETEDKEVENNENNEEAREEEDTEEEDTEEIENTEEQEEVTEEETNVEETEEENTEEVVEE